MYYLLPFVVVSLTFLVIGLIRPKIIDNFFHCKLTQLKMILIFGILTVVFASTAVFVALRTTKTDVAGVTTTKQAESSTNEQNDEPEVKRSTNGICHAKGTKYYDLVINYKSFSSMETCLQGDNRLPKK